MIKKLKKKTHNRDNTVGMCKGFPCSVSMFTCVVYCVGYVGLADHHAGSNNEVMISHGAGMENGVKLFCRIHLFRHLLYDWRGAHDGLGHGFVYFALGSGYTLGLKT